MNEVLSIVPKPMLDESNPYSLVSLVDGEAFSNAVAKVSSDLLQMDETELRKLAKPTKTDYAIRTALWNEFRQVHDTGGRIRPARVYGGICTYQHWYYNILNVPAKLAWVLQPLEEFEKGLEPLLGRVVERYDELINLDIYDSHGKPNPALAKIVLEAMKMVEFRLKGATVQRLETKNLNVSSELKSGIAVDNMTMEEIDRQLEELRKRRRV